MTAQRVEVAPATVEHFYLCPCGTCQGVRARRPVVAAMQAKHLSGASIGKLVEVELGRSLVTNEHQWSPSFTLDAIHHSGYELTIYGDDGIECELRPESWVRVTVKVES